ncbi:GNAT family N-acetyltransferase [Epibacterium sp. SM1979]|uniref:GNAT family N-acetyltransferase n=1 Tax=Tritonibacter litoralis TaxID=2662264 RepID=A0A843YJ63_9RHOB|nr:GNAT family N-acetyltransferase [Tritonibacter litoralis]
MAQTHLAAFSKGRAWTSAEFTSLLQSPLVFAHGDNRCFALVRVVADEAELLTLATHPDHQRHGLARGLMEDWHRVAQQRGAQHAFLEVAADNSAARRLYDTCAYETVATRPGYYARSDGPDVDALVMRHAFV